MFKDDYFMSAEDIYSSAMELAHREALLGMGFRNEGCRWNFKENGRMRITGGVLRGRKIDCPVGIIRPAMDKMKESVFSILGDIEEHSFLDLFSGSGSIALEASSRGANPVVLVEKDKIKFNTIKKNIQIQNPYLLHTNVSLPSFF